MKRLAHPRWPVIYNPILFNLEHTLSYMVSSTSLQICHVKCPFLSTHLVMRMDRIFFLWIVARIDQFWSIQILTCYQGKRCFLVFFTFLNLATMSEIQISTTAYSSFTSTSLLPREHTTRKERVKRTGCFVLILTPRLVNKKFSLADYFR